MAELDVRAGGDQAPSDGERAQAPAPGKDTLAARLAPASAAVQRQQAGGNDAATPLASPPASPGDARAPAEAPGAGLLDPAQLAVARRRNAQAWHQWQRDGIDERAFADARPDTDEFALAVAAFQASTGTLAVDGIVDPATCAAKGVAPRATATAPAIQAHAEGALADPARTQRIAADGVAGPGQPLPYLADLERSFGARGDGLRDVRAHVGGDAEAAADRIGAHAYATGDDVALPAGADLHLVAHEAAHTVQQRAGVALKGGVGEAGDPYEQQADAVADAVVAGRSAEALLAPSAGATAPTVQRDAKAPVSVGAREYVQTFGAELLQTLRVALGHIEWVPRGPYGPQLAGANLFSFELLEYIQQRASASVFDGLQRFVAPEPLEAMVDRARGHDWDTSDEEHPFQKATGPASETYATPVATEIANAIARRYIDSVTRLVPQFVAAYIDLQAMNESEAVTTVPHLQEGAGALVAIHTMDSAVIHALYASQDSIPFATLAAERPELLAQARAKFAAPGPHSLDTAADRPTQIRFRTEDGLFHWVEAAPAGFMPILGPRTATEVAKALFQTSGDDQAAEEAYRLTQVGSLWGFHASDVHRFKPEHREELFARWARTSRTIAWPADIANAIGGAVSIPPPADQDPIAELGGQGPQLALDHARGLAPEASAAGKDEASVASRITEDLKLVDGIGRTLGLINRDPGALADARDRLAGRYQEATRSDACMADTGAAFTLADRQGAVLADVAAGLGDMAIKYATYGGVAMDPSLRPIFDDCVAPFTDAIVALDFPDVAAARAAIGTQRALAFDISAQELSLHGGVPLLDDGMREEHLTPDFAAVDDYRQTTDLAYDLGAIRMGMASSPAQATSDLSKKSKEVSTLELDVNLGEKLMRLDQLWQAIEGEEGFWQIVGSGIGVDSDLHDGIMLQNEGKALRAEFVTQVKEPFEKAKLANDDAGKMAARDAFDALVKKFKPYAKRVTAFLKTTEGHKKWAKIVVGIAIAVVAFALGQFEFALVLDATDSVFGAAVAGGLVASSSTVVLEKLILNQDPTVGGLITGFIGNVAIFGLLGKAMMAARAAGAGAEMAEATVGAAQATKDGELAADAASAAGAGAESATIGSKVANAAIGMTWHVLLGEAIMLVQSEATSLIDNHRLLDGDEMKETLAMGVVNVIGMHIGNFAFESAVESFRGMRAAAGIDIDALLRERQGLHDDGKALQKAAGGEGKLAKGAAPRDQAQALIDRWQRYLEHERQVIEQLRELAEKHPAAFRSKLGELEKLRRVGDDEAALSRQLREARAILGVQEVGPGLFRGDPAAFDAILAQHKASGGELTGVSTDPHTGQRTLSVRLADGGTIEIVEQLPDVGKRTPPKVSVGAARYFEAWLDQLDTSAPEAAQQKQRLVEYYARDPEAAIELATERYHFAPGELPETDLLVHPDAAAPEAKAPEAKPGEPGATAGKRSAPAPAEPSPAERAFDQYAYEREGEPQVSRMSDERVMGRSDFDAMYKAGYEYDPVARDWVARPGTTTRAGGTGFTAPETTQVVGALPSEAVGHEVLRKLVSGEAEALRVVGVEAPADFDPRTTEWALGRNKDGSIVLIRGGKGEVNWAHIPGVEDLAHSHPIIDPITGEPRYLGGSADGTIDVKDLRNSATEHDLRIFFPSAGDLEFVGLRKSGGHRLHTPYVYLGDGKIGNPRPGVVGDSVEIVIGDPTPYRLLADKSSVVIWKSEVQIWAGDQMLGTETLYNGFLDAGVFKADLPSLHENAAWKEIPADHPVRKATAPDATPSGTGVDFGHISAEVAERLHKVWGVDVTEPHAQAALKGLTLNDATTLSWLSFEAIAGRTQVGFPEWMKRFNDPAQRAAAMEDARLAFRELDADPLATVKFDGTGKPLFSSATRADVPPEAIAAAKNVAGGANTKLNQYVFASPADQQAAFVRVRAAAQTAGERAYMDAINAGETPKKASKAASAAANKTIQALGAWEAADAAARAGEDAIQNDTAFDEPKLDADAQWQLAAYRSGNSTVGARGRQLMAILPGMRVADFLSFMGTEVTKNGAQQQQPTEIDAPDGMPTGSPATQMMDKWDYPDGTQVRYKPLGDKNRPGTPTFSVEVKKDATVYTNTNPDEAAFKLDANGRPVPKSDKQALNPYSKPEQIDAFDDALMQAVHFELIP